MCLQILGQICLYTALKRYTRQICMYVFEITLWVEKFKCQCIFPVVPRLWSEISIVANHVQRSFIRPPPHVSVFDFSMRFRLSSTRQQSKPLSVFIWKRCPEWRHLKTEPYHISIDSENVKRKFSKTLMSFTSRASIFRLACTDDCCSSLLLRRFAFFFAIDEREGRATGHEPEPRGTMGRRKTRFRLPSFLCAPIFLEIRETCGYEAAVVAFSSVLVWTGENATKTIVWTQSFWCVFNENGAFWKRIRVDGVLVYTNYYLKCNDNYSALLLLNLQPPDHMNDTSILM